MRAKTFFESQEKEQVLPFDIGHINLRTPEAVFSLQDKLTKKIPVDEENINYSSDEMTYDDIESDKETGSFDEDDDANEE